VGISIQLRFAQNGAAAPKGRYYYSSALRSASLHLHGVINILPLTGHIVRQIGHIPLKCINSSCFYCMQRRMKMPRCGCTYYGRRRLVFEIFYTFFRFPFLILAIPVFFVYLHVFFENGI
jgi:hypothetical protein